MRARLIFVVSAIMIASTIYSQTATQELGKPRRPPKEVSSPGVRTPTTFPRSDLEIREDTRPLTAARLPAFNQDRVFGNLNSAFGEVERIVSDGRPELYSDFKAARVDFEKLTAFKGEPLPNLTLWSLIEDAGMIREYATTRDQKYAAAAFKHVRSIARAKNPADKANVTVITVNNRGRRRNGFEICYTAAEWSDLANPPTLTFPKPSGSSENLPKTNWTFWSRNFQDPSKVGPKTSKSVDGEETLSIGIPPN